MLVVVKPIFKTQYQYIYIHSLLCVGKIDHLICILCGALEPPYGRYIFRPIFYYSFQTRRNI